MQQFITQCNERGAPFQQALPPTHTGPPWFIGVL